MKQEFTKTEAADWTEAAMAIRAYLRAVPMNDHPRELFLAERIIMSAKDRWRREPARQPLQIAMEEAILEVTSWTSDILLEPLGAKASGWGILSTRSGGHLSGEPMAHGQRADFIGTLRSSRRGARPAADGLDMDAQPLELNAFGTGAATIWESMDRNPSIRRMTGLLLLGLLAIGLWFIFL